LAFAFASLSAPERNACDCTALGRAKDYFWEGNKSQAQSEQLRRMQVKWMKQSKKQTLPFAGKRKPWLRTML